MPAPPDSPLGKFQSALRSEIYGDTPQNCCLDCKQPFSDKNVFTEGGWKEVRISGLCEKCWDDLFAEAVEPEIGALKRETREDDL